jgi:hypothetical protein
MVSLEGILTENALEIVPQSTRQKGLSDCQSWRYEGPKEVKGVREKVGRKEREKSE